MLGQFYHAPVSLCVSGTIKTQNGIQPQAPSEVGDIRQEVLSVARKDLNWAPKCPHFKRNNMTTLPCCYSSVRMETIKLLPSPLLFPLFSFTAKDHSQTARWIQPPLNLETYLESMCVFLPSPFFLASAALECFLRKCSQRFRRTELYWLEWGFYVHFRDESSLLFCSYTVFYCHALG